MKGKPTKAKRLVGRSFSNNTAVVILRSGQLLNNVTVLEKSFSVQTDDLGVLKIPTPNVKTIVYKNLPSYPTDMLRTVSSSEFNGPILNDPVKMKSEDLGGTVSIAKAKLISIVW